MMFVLFNSSLTGITSGAGTTNFYEPPEFTPGVCVAQSLVFCVVFCVV